MNPSENTPERPDQHCRRGGLAGDVRQLKTHGSATAAELREFLAQTRGRNAQEVLGLVAESQLTRSITLAAVGTVIVLVAASVIPWLIGYGPAARNGVKRPATTAAGEETEMPDVTPDHAKNAGSTTQPSSRTMPNGTDTRKAVKAMGLDETKAADPNTNPLEHRLDDLLDKVK